MQEAILTVLTIAASAGLLIWAIVQTGFFVGELKQGGEEAIGGRIGFACLSFALALTCFSMTGFLRIGRALTTSDSWSGPYVAHMPLASEVWAATKTLLHYRAPLMEAAPTFAFWLQIATAVFVGFGLLMLWRVRQDRRSARDYFETNPLRKVLVRSLLFIAVYAVFFQVLLFVLAFVLGTAAFLTENWWILVILVLLGAGGGATYIYDSNGNKIGKITRY